MSRQELQTRCTKVGPIFVPLFLRFHYDYLLLFRKIILKKCIARVNLPQIIMQQQLGAYGWWNFSCGAQNLGIRRHQKFWFVILTAVLLFVLHLEYLWCTEGYGKRSVTFFEVFEIG
jgi:hypothetical protein